jgi:hypothetical protein
MVNSGDGLNTLLEWKRNETLLSVQFMGSVGPVEELKKVRISGLAGMVLTLDFISHKKSYELLGVEICEKVPRIPQNSFTKAVKLSTTHSGSLILLELAAG